MKDTSRQPTTLARLEELVQQQIDRDDGLDDDTTNINQWLQWTHNFLSARKLYHKKHTLRNAIIKRMAETLLSKDELEAIDMEAEKQLGNLDDEPIQPKVIVGVCREDNPHDVDEAYGKGTYARLFPTEEEEPDLERDRR
jgi:hypothetical protein